MLLMGKYNNRIDQKNRIFLPAKFREILGNTVVLTIDGRKGCIKCYGSVEFERKFAEMENEISNMLGEDDILTDTFAETQDVNVDNQGRISIPPEQCELAQLGETALIVGMGRYVEIWNEENFKLNREKARENVKKVKDVDAMMREAVIEAKKREANAVKNGDSV